MDKKRLIEIIRSECVATAGCTDPGCVALAVSRARRELGVLPEKISVQVSFNIYKNGVSVRIPGTGEHGLELAAALGALIDNYEDGLAILSHVTDALLKQAKGFVTDGRVILTYGAASDPLLCQS
jgi:L-cysteine desulfidase